MENSSQFPCAYETHLVQANIQDSNLVRLEGIDHVQHFNTAAYNLKVNMKQTE